MAVGTDAAKEEVDAAIRGYHAFVVLALFDEVGGVAVEDMDVLWLDIDIAEEIGPHKGVVALTVFFRQTDVLVHIEGDNVLEGYLIIIRIRVRAAVGKTDKSVRRCLSGYIVTVTYTESSGQTDIFKYEGLIINRTDTVAIEEAGSVGAVNSIEILDRQIVRRF